MRCEEINVNGWRCSRRGRWEYESPRESIVVCTRHANLRDTAAHRATSDRWLDLDDEVAVQQAIDRLSKG